MKLCRFKNKSDQIRIGLITADNSTVLDLSSERIKELFPLLENENSISELNQLAKKNLPRIPLVEIKLLPPVERQEIWAAGVTYLRSKTARMEESDFSASAYDKVYAAERPEIFFKSLPEKVVGNSEAVGIRRDSKWNVPEPELALVMNSKGKIVGHTIGNDMSSRDIEGENLLYLPQAKIYERSCALGPWIHLGASETETRKWKIQIEIKRVGQIVFNGETSVSQIKRNFEQLAEFLFRSQKFPNGAILLTGTGIVPPETFTLLEKDLIEIEISGIGLLKNFVAVV
jgi:2-dehydro-3-deoxy-D-arabinonate dehydratase